jgi:phage FluMu gp28-like protein
MTAPVTKEQWADIRRQTVDVMGDLKTRLGLDKVLLPYQARTISLLNSVSRIVLFVDKSRRIGLTWGLASEAALRASRAKRAGGSDCLYISYSLDMTREFIEAVGMFARAFAIAALDMDEFVFEDSDEEDPSKTKHIQAFRIRFASGFEVVGLSSAPRSLRGKQGFVIIDEAAFVDSLKELLKSALANKMWGGKIVVCSTHNGADNDFNVFIQDILAKRLPYRHMRIDLDDALKEGLFQRICVVTGEQWSPEYEAKWRQELIDDYGDGADEELFCIPAQGSGAFLTAPLIEARMTLGEDKAPIIRIALPPDYLQLSKLAQAQLFEPQLDRVKRAVENFDETEMHSFGYDPARKSDPAVITVLATEKALKRRSVLTVEMRNVPFDEQKRIAWHILKNAPRLTGAAVDATGMGMNLAEDLGREFGLREDEESGGLIWAVSLRAKWYNENFPPLKAAFEDDMIALARDLEHASDLRLVKVIRGIPMIPDEREGVAGKKRHGDFAVALVLAHFASRMRFVEYGYEAGTPPGRERGGDFMLAGEDSVAERDWWEPPLGAGLRGGI